MKDQRKTDKYQRKCSLSLPLSLSVDRPLRSIHTCDLLGTNYCLNVSVRAIAKWVHNPLLNFQSMQKLTK